MEKYTLSAIAISIFLVSIATGMLDVGEAKANFGSIPSIPPAVSIVNPADSSAQSNNVTIVFNVTFYGITFLGTIIPYRIEFRYRLDNQPSTSIRPATIVSSTTENSAIRQCKFTLLNLSDGPHRIQVSAKIGKTRSTDGDVTWNFVGIEGVSVPVNFSVDGVAPRISILSPEERAYNSIDLSLEWITPEETSLSWYQLDNQANVTADGNSTLTNLSEGTHSVVVYANDTAGNIGKSDAIVFTVSTATPSPPPTQQPTPSPTTSSPTQQPTLEPAQLSDNVEAESNDVVFYLVGGVAAGLVVLFFFVLRSRKN